MSFQRFKLQLKMTGESNKTLYVGNLHPSVTEELVKMLFTQLGEVLNCKMFQESNSDPYCFIEFNDRTCALNAITMMNDKILNSRKMRVDWATGHSNKNKTVKVDTTKHFHVYVGELSPEIDEEALREAFKPFGEISDCKVVKDPQTFKSRGYGFVVFVEKCDAEVSIQSMNSQWLGRKMIKVRWATKKLSTASPPETKVVEANNLDYDDVFSQTTGTNTTVFCGGLKQDITEETLQEAFEAFGTIDKIKIFKEKGFAFIKYTCKEHACQAIVAKHNSVINGQTIRCSWGKDTGPEGQQVLPSAASPTLMDHSSVVASPIPTPELSSKVLLGPCQLGCCGCCCFGWRCATRYAADGCCSCWTSSCGCSDQPLHRSSGIRSPSTNSRHLPTLYSSHCCWTSDTYCPAT